MTEKKEICRCMICGNIVEVLHEGDGTLVCCGQPMIRMRELEEEEGKEEKHKPVIESDEEGVIVRVGAVEHPMTEEHYIEWIEISTENGCSKKFLKPGDEPVAKFPIKVDVSKITTRAYCNLHGLWRS